MVQLEDRLRALVLNRVSIITHSPHIANEAYCVLYNALQKHVLSFRVWILHANNTSVFVRSDLSDDDGGRERRKGHR